MMNQVAQWGFPIGKFELQLMVKDLLNNKGLYDIQYLVANI